MSVPSEVGKAGTAAIDEHRLTVVLDVRHPFAYLGLGPAQQLAQQRGLEINWLPLAWQALRPPSEPSPEDDRGVLHKRSRAQAIAREIETYAAAQGLVLRDCYREPDPSLVHAAWLYARANEAQRLDDVMSRSFEAYWSCELDVEDASAVAGLLDGLGVSGDDYLAWVEPAGRATLEALEGELRERGVPQVPCYWIDDEVFVGRQHLPFIEWILDGREGPGPI